MSISINNGILIYGLFFFSFAWFLTHLFIKAGTFLKICLFFISFSLFIPLEQLNSIPITLASFLGAITAYYGGILSAFSSVKNNLVDFLYWLKDVISILFTPFRLLLLEIVKAVIFIISVLKRRKKPTNKKSSNSSDKQEHGNNKNNSRDYEEHSQRAKEQFRQAREEAKIREEQESQDTRSFEEIIGVNPGYTNNDLKTAYKRSVSKYHPDHYSHMSKNFKTEAEQEFKKIQKAYNALSDRLN